MDMLKIYVQLLLKVYLIVILTSFVVHLLQQQRTTRKKKENKSLSLALIVFRSVLSYCSVGWERIKV